jgi:uncharacterized protein YegL
MGNVIQKTDNKSVTTSSDTSAIDNINALRAGQKAALSKTELPRQFSQLVLFVLDGSDSMQRKGTSGFSRGEEVHDSILKVLERLQKSKNRSSFDVGFWAFAEESKEMYSIRQVKQFNIKDDSFNPCKVINNGNGTRLFETLQSLELIINNYLYEHKDLNRKVLVIILSDGEIHDYEEVIEIKSKLQSENIVFSSIFYESIDWEDFFDEMDLNEIKENLSNLASKDAYFLSSVDPEKIRQHMIQSVTKISNI